MAPIHWEYAFPYSFGANAHGTICGQILSILSWSTANEKENEITDTNKILGQTDIVLFKTIPKPQPGKI